MPFTLSITSYGETIVERKLARFAANLEQPQHALEAVGDVAREAVEGQFNSEGQRASGGWPALSRARVKYKAKAKQGLDPRILRATDRLFKSLTNKFDRDHIERPSSESLLFGSDVPYGIYHQSSRPRTVIPFRPPVAFTEADKRNMVKRIQAELLGSVEKAMWGV
jgi:phage gpG-like protein